MVMLGRSGYGGGASSTSVELPTMDLSPLEMARTLLSREQDYLSKRRKTTSSAGATGVSAGGAGAPRYHRAPSTPGGLGQQRTDFRNPAEWARVVVGAGPQRPDTRAQVRGNLDQYNLALSLLGVPSGPSPQQNVLGPSFFEDQARGPSVYERNQIRSAEETRKAGSESPEWFDLPLFAREQMMRDADESFWQRQNMSPYTKEYLQLLYGR